MLAAWRNRAALGLVSLFGVALCSRSLGYGLCLDDRAMLSTVVGPRVLPASPPLDLFVFASGQSAAYADLVARGVYPWYTAQNFKVSFWRPVASLSHTLDFALFPDRPAWMHLQNLLWYGLLIIVVGLLYRRFLGSGWAAMLATALYAVHDLHGLSVGWISARNTLMGATFAAWSLLAHDRWVRDGWSRGRYLGPAAFALSLFSSEATVTMLGYLLAHAVFMQRASLAQRARTLAPYGAIVGSWLTFYVGTGRGASGSGVYLDPFREPLSFAALLPGRVLLEFVAQVSGETAHPWIALLGVGMFSLCSVPLAVVNRTAAFFLVGLVGSTIVVAGVSPDPRHLLHAGLGAFPVLALTIAAAAGSLTPRPRTRAWRMLAVAVGLCSVVQLGLLSAVRMPRHAALASVVQQAFDRHPLPASSSTASGKTLVVVNAADPILAGMWSLPASRRDPRPYRVWSLSFVRGPVIVSRTGPRGIKIHANDGHMSAPSSRMFRRDPLQADARFRLPGITIDVVDSGGPNGPTEVQYAFDMPLDDPSLVWLAWNGTHYAPFPIPAIAQSVSVNPQPL